MAPPTWFSFIKDEVVENIEKINNSCPLYTCDVNTDNQKYLIDTTNKRFWLSVNNSDIKTINQYKGKKIYPLLGSVKDNFNYLCDIDQEFEIINLNIAWGEKKIFPPGANLNDPKLAELIPEMNPGYYVQTQGTNYQQISTI